MDELTTIISNTTVYSIFLQYGNNSNHTYGNESYDNGSFDCYGKIDTISTKVLTLLTVSFFVIGFIGNFLSFLVFSSKDMITVSSHIFLLTLAISDTGYLISSFMTHDVSSLRCIFKVKLYDPYNMNSFCCKFVQFIIDLFSDYSTCLILFFTIERFIAVYKPTDYRIICTTVRAKYVCLLSFLVIAVVIFPYHYNFMDLYEGTSLCTISKGHQELFSALYIAEVTCFRILPVFIIALLNGLIVYHFRQVTRTSSSWREAVRQRARREETSRKLTTILLLVSTTYIISYLPSLIYFIVNKMQQSKLKYMDTEAYRKYYDNSMLWLAYTNALYIFGFSVNFFLYTVSGPMFRQHLIRLFSAFNIKKWWVFQRMGCVAPMRADSVVQTEQSRTTLLHDKALEPYLPQNGTYRNNNRTMQSAV